MFIPLILCAIKAVAEVMELKVQAQVAASQQQPPVRA